MKDVVCLAMTATCVIWSIVGIQVIRHMKRLASEFEDDEPWKESLRPDDTEGSR